MAKKDDRSKHPLYTTYHNMKYRCYNPKVKAYHRYGGRGIKVCDRWLEDFWNFVEDMGERPQGHTIDRINNDKGYSPGNCRWATITEQTNNTKSNRHITIQGERQTVAYWVKKYKIHVSTIYSRLEDGWSEEDAVTKPVRGYRIKQLKEELNGGKD